MRSLIVVTTLGLAALFGSTSAHAWGAKGHRIVCEIAYQELKPEARDVVRALIASDGSFSTFADSCTWADEKQQKNARRQDHFINVPRYYYEVRTGRCRLGDTCLFSAIDFDVNRLSYSTKKKERLASLKYLGHWVGDIHQPLHVSYADDWGGNKVVQTSDLCYDTLHSVWDSCVISSYLRGSVQEEAQKLLSELGERRTAWNDTTPIEWADESYDITRQAWVSYCNLSDKNVCFYGPGDEFWEPGDDQKTVHVDEDYLETALPIVRERLLMAGVRLGALLNRILAPETWD